MARGLGIEQTTTRISWVSRPKNANFGQVHDPFRQKLTATRQPMG
jgi:hypothetical protein